MPEQRQHIFRLSKEDGLSNEEIAQQLHISRRTVENQLYRAVSMLKEKIGTSSLAALLFFFLHCK
jgi:RNA polymerase sigma-70 factor (ECF subfamily)